MPGAERTRVESFGHPEDGLHDATPWYDWGPYLSERAWGTVREDYSADGTAWDYFPHDHARSRAYRWGEDGMAGRQRRRPASVHGARAVERPRPDPEGADVRSDGSAGQPWRGRQGVLVVPGRAPQPRLAAVALPLPAGRVPVCRPGGRERPSRPDASRSTSCWTPGVFDDDRYWVVDVAHAKADPHDLLMEVSVTNAGPEPATLHVLPQLWFRNTWSWDVGAERPSLRATAADRVAVDHPVFGELAWELDAGPDGAATRAAVLRERHQPRAALRLGRTRRHTRRTGSTTTSSPARRR